MKRIFREKKHYYTSVKWIFCEKSAEMSCYPIGLLRTSGRPDVPLSVPFFIPFHSHTSLTRYPGSICGAMFITFLSPERHDFNSVFFSLAECCWSTVMYIMHALLAFLHLSQFPNNAPAGFPMSGNGLWYTHPGRAWAREFLPVGNGYLGGQQRLFLLASI